MIGFSLDGNCLCSDGTACAPPLVVVDGDGDGSPDAVDCAPLDPSIFPGAPEICDDGIDNNCDTLVDQASPSCTSIPPPQAIFRVSDLDWRDPHVFVSSFLGCIDFTDTGLFGVSLNGDLQAAITTDGDGDGLLDFNLLLAFDTFNQLPGGTGTVRIVEGTCTAPMASTSCTLPPSSTPPSAYANLATGSCLPPVPGTLRPYNPAVITPAAPCLETAPILLEFPLFGIAVPLTNVQTGAAYVNDPATELTGVIRGFLSETDADALIIPASFPIVGGQPVSSLLRGGNLNCASGSDQDVLNGVTGWWIYLNFRATRLSS